MVLAYTARIRELSKEMDPSRNSPPVAVRVLRPFANEDELLAAESNAFTRTGVVLIGAPSRPNGVVLRFEICLRDGQVAMRGEGRVVGFRAQSADDESALMLRFTRLDVKSKALLDRAVALREERKSLAPIPPRPPAGRSSATPPPPRASAIPPPAPPPPVIPPASVAPTTERDDDHDDDRDDDDAMEVNEADLTSVDDNDLTAQAPPVAMMADLVANERKEKMPVPQPPPVEPTPAPRAPVAPAPPVRAPERMPAPAPAAPEKMPVPQRSPGPTKHASELIARARGGRDSGDFRPSLEPEQRNSALDRLRERKRESQS